MKTGGAAWRVGVIAVAVAATGCPSRVREGEAAADAASDAASDATATATPTPTATATATPTDAGPSFCRPLFGPLELPVRSPVTLSIHPDGVDAVLDEDGKPRVVTVPAGPISASVSGTRETLDGGSAPGLSVRCAVAGDHFFCPDRGGSVHRTVRGGAGDKVTASARTASRIAAGLLEGGHFALAYLASRQTSEGWVTEAWLAVDDLPPVRVSEDGSGATAITLSQHGPALLVLSVDARTALTTMHARVVTFKDGALHLGEDAVLFVGGPGDRHTGPAVALGPLGAGVGLLPIARDLAEFGLAIVRIDDPPRVDEPVGWSMYPNGLDPAPVAAAMGLRGAGAAVTWVASVRPVTAQVGSERVLEIGEVAGSGLDYVARQVVAGTTGTIKDTSLAVDGRGALWLAWQDAAGSWLERLACK